MSVALPMSALGVKRKPAHCTRALFRNSIFLTDLSGCRVGPWSYVCPQPTDVRMSDIGPYWHLSSQLGQIIMDTEGVSLD